MRLFLIAGVLLSLITVAIVILEVAYRKFRSLRGSTEVIALDLDKS